jgi:CRP-like cAMP-binding protein
MDLLERARTLAACPLFESLAPAVIIRLAERARTAELERGERRTTDDDVWVVAAGSLAVAVREATGNDAFATASIVRKRGAGALPGNALGLVRVVRPDTPVIEVVAEVPSTLVGLAVDDVRDVLEEDPAALAAIADRLAALLLDDAA